MKFFLDTGEPQGPNTLGGRKAGGLIDGHHDQSVPGCQAAQANLDARDRAEKTLSPSTVGLTR